MNTIETPISDAGTADIALLDTPDLEHSEDNPTSSSEEIALASSSSKASSVPMPPALSSEEISQAAAKQVNLLAGKFESQYGYKPSDETLFGWQMQAETAIQNQIAQRTAALEELESQAEEVQTTFEQSGFSRDAGRHYVNIVKDSGPEILAHPGLNRLAVAQAIGLSMLEGRAARKPTRSVSGEPVSGDASAGNLSRESDDARKHLRIILKREPSAAEIKEWIDL